MEVELNKKIAVEKYDEEEKGIQEKGESLLWWEWWTTYVYGKEKDPYGMINYIVIKEFKNDKTALSLVYPAFVDPEKSQRYYAIDKYSYKDFSAEKKMTNIKIKDNTMLEKDNIYYINGNTKDMTISWHLKAESVANMKPFKIMDNFPCNLLQELSFLTQMPDAKITGNITLSHPTQLHPTQSSVSSDFNIDTYGEIEHLWGNILSTSFLSWNMAHAFDPTNIIQLYYFHVPNNNVGFLRINFNGIVYKWYLPDFSFYYTFGSDTNYPTHVSLSNISSHSLSSSFPLFSITYKTTNISASDKSSASENNISLSLNWKLDNDNTDTTYTLNGISEYHLFNIFGADSLLN